ncbi:MAG: TetR/AcrR family transcriptional regulator [Frankia sp.]
MKQNANLTSEIADRIAQRTMTQRGPDYAGEVRRLLDAALDVMRQCGTSSRPRVADIVAAAGLSNDAFYRHFPSKEALVAALVEDGAHRLGSYLVHQMAKQPTPEGQIRCWVEGVLSQTAEGIAATTAAVLWNGGSVGEGTASGRHFASEPLTSPLKEPLAALGSADPDLDASLVAHATLGKMSDYLWKRTQPSPEEIDRITAFCLAGVTGRRRRAIHKKGKS